MSPARPRFLRIFHGLFNTPTLAPTSVNAFADSKISTLMFPDARCKPIASTKPDIPPPLKKEVSDRTKSSVPNSPYSDRKFGLQSFSGVVGSHFVHAGKVGVQRSCYYNTLISQVFIEVSTFPVSQEVPFALGKLTTKSIQLQFASVERLSPRIQVAGKLVYHQRGHQGRVVLYTSRRLESVLICQNLLPRCSSIPLRSF